MSKEGEDMFKEGGNMPNVNWEKYREVFPTKYFEISIFDKAFIYMINLYRHKNPKAIISLLDIGGGAIKDSIGKMVDEYFLLDPNISRTSYHWKDLDFSICAQFTFIRMRGSIAYLSEEEIRRLAYALTAGSIIGFNTFAFAPENHTKKYRAKQSKGTEIITYNSVNQEVHHILIPDNKNSIPITHSFKYRSFFEYTNWLDPHRKAYSICNFIPHNSLFAFLSKNPLIVNELYSLPIT